MLESPDRPLHILAVDDELGNLELVQAILDEPGVVVLTATNGQDALKLLASHEVALALLDVRMPQMSGFELATRIRATPAGETVPIIFLTGEGRIEKKLEGYGLGAVDFLVKPVEPDMLLAKVKAVLTLRLQMREIQANLRLNELFVAVLAHDLRSPLSAATIGADLLRRSPDATTSDIATSIFASSRRMAAMIDQLTIFRAHAWAVASRWSARRPISQRSWNVRSESSAPPIPAAPF